MSSAADSKLVLYLLGALRPGDGLEVVEERLFTDDGLFDRLLELERGLVEARLAGRLGATERRLFDSYFLASPRRRALWESRRREMAAAGGARRSASRPVFALPFRPAWAVAATCLLLAGGLVFSVFSLRRSDRELAGLRSRVTALAQRPAAAVAVFPLVAGRARSVEPPPAVVPARDGAVLRLRLPDTGARYDSFDVALRTAEGDLLWRQRHAAADAGELPVLLPASALRPADYVLSVCGESGGGCVPLPSYVFRVPRGN